MIVLRLVNKGDNMRAKNKFGMKFWAFVAPIFIPFIIFYIIPVCMSFFYSFFEWNGISSSMKFIGLGNYQELFTSDPHYFGSMGFSMRFALFSVVFTNALAILVAIWVSGKLKTANILRGCFFMPNIICAIVVGFLWRFVFNQITTTLYGVTGLAVFGTKWLANGNSAFYAVLLVSLWQTIGYNMIIYVAGLSAIDETLYESAAIDGAGRITKFFKITIPMLMPSITICLFNTTAQAFRLFDINISLTNGGPGRSTMGLALDIYNTAFGQNRMGYGSAKAVILLLVVMTITMLQLSYTKRREVQM